MRAIMVTIILLTTGCAVLQDRKAAVAYAYAGTPGTWKAFGSIAP